MSIKPSIPKGTRDFLPTQMAKRNYIFDTIRRVYRTCGYREIETPAMEHLTTLLGKYGEEGDKLLFRILNSGDPFKEIDPDLLGTLPPADLAARICDRGLRYDLTVPFARFVVQHKHELTFPFRRFQIQPVWRADRPQRGRYREFFQCDADVIGSDSLLLEVELVQMMDRVFSELGIRVAIQINNRKILTGIGELLGARESVAELTVAMDKLDKIGWEGVAKELATKGFSDEQVERLHPIVLQQGTTMEKLDRLREVLTDSPIGQKGIAELRYVFDRLALTPLTNQLELNLSLARGLNYYTGAIFEVKALDVEIGSITGGGRYDDLTGVFGESGMSGVGISFGADRIYDVLNTLDLYPEETTTGTQILFVNFGEQEERYILPILARLRTAGIASELYPDTAKMKKQMSYADALGIPLVAFVGTREIEEQIVTVKDMSTGEQAAYTVEQLIEALN